MPALSPEDRSAIVEDAMRRKFGDLLNWARPELIHTFGPNDLDVVDHFEAKLEETRKLVRATLAGWSDKRIQDLGARLWDKSRIDDQEWQALGESAIDSLSRKTPPPIAFGFGHPSFEVNFDYWGRMPQLTIYEALALSVGAEPSIIDESCIKLARERTNMKKEKWSAFKLLARRFDTFRIQYIYFGGGLVDPSPAQLKSWIDETQLDVYPEFYNCLAKRSTNANRTVQTKGSDTLSSQERETLLKLIAAMACEQYNYDPNIERNEATSRIREDVELVGLSMDAKTIRKWLKEASQLVDPSYWTKSG